MRLSARTRGRSFALAVLAAAPLSLATPGAEPLAEPTAADVLEFRLATNGDKGVVRCGLFEADGWLKRPVRSATAKIRGNVATCAFQRVPSGTFGASAFHDENENGKLDTNLIGLPTEDYCASRNARGTFGPPSFKDAKFVYRGGLKRIEARMK